METDAPYGDETQDGLSVEFGADGKVVAASGPGVTVDDAGNIVVPGIEPQDAPAKHPSSDGLRALADWLDKAHAAGVTTNIDTKLSCFPADDDVSVIARQMGTFEKKYADVYDLMELVKDFGGFELHAVFTRSLICKRVVTGTKTIPATVVPAKPAEPERVIPEQTIETVEWQCGESLLAKTFDQLQEAAS